MVTIELPSELINEFEVIPNANIGSGAFGTVFLAKEKCKNDTNSQTLYAMKILDSPADERSKKNIETEIRVLSQVKCPYIVHLNRNIEVGNQVYLIMEYCENGELNKAICDRAAISQPFEEDEIWKYFIQICLGLEYLHSHKIIHRDIKPQNIFLDKNRDIKIGDFGLSLYQAAGTYQYYAPEMWNDDNPSYESDIWALGCVLYELCNFEIPFNGNPMKIQFEQHEPIRDQYSDELRFIVDWCLEKEKSRRPTITNLLERKIIANKIISLGINIPNTSVLLSRKICIIVEDDSTGDTKCIRANPYWTYKQLCEELERNGVDGIQTDENYVIARGNILLFQVSKDKTLRELRIEDCERLTIIKHLKGC